MALRALLRHNARFTDVADPWALRVARARSSLSNARQGTGRDTGTARHSGLEAGARAQVTYVDCTRTHDLDRSVPGSIDGVGPTAALRGGRVLTPAGKVPIVPVENSATQKRGDQREARAIPSDESEPGYRCGEVGFHPMIGFSCVRSLF